MRDRVLIGILLAASALVYANTLQNQLVFDDGMYITSNPQVTNPSFRSIFSPHHYSRVYRPLTFLTFAANWSLGGAEPAGYHLVNLLLHAGVTWLLFLLLEELLASLPCSKIVAFAAAVLYAVHPIHTEAVSWIVGRAELLAAAFLFAGWILHLRNRPVGSLLCFALALLSKESAVAFFPLLLLGDYATGKWKPRIRYAFAASLAFLYIGLLWKVEGGHLGRATVAKLDNPLASLPVGWRVLNALRVAWKYVALQLYPRVLSCDYSFNQIPLFRNWRHTLPAALATAAVVGLWIWAVHKRLTAPILAGALYFAGFAVTANILMPTGTIMGERLAYLPSAGFCLLLALGWNWLQERQRIAAWGLLAAIALLFSARTVLRNRDWKDNFALYSSAVRASPNSAKMHSNLGDEYAAHNQPDLAAAQYEIALQIYPDNPDTLASYSALQFQRGDYQAAGATLERALNRSKRGFLNYDFMLVKHAEILEKTNHSDAALAELNQEISESPEYIPAWLVRANLQYHQGAFAAARADAEQALRLNPADLQAQELLQRLTAFAPSDAPH